MGFVEIEKRSGVKFEKGGRVRYTGGVTKPAQEGTIVGAKKNHLIIRLDGDAFDKVLSPTWEIQYLGKQEKKGGKRANRKA